MNVPPGFVVSITMENTTDDRKRPSRRPLVEGIDFYIENGLYVFTEHFLRERGYCCRTGCRHCPYGFRPEENGNGPDEKEE